MANDNPYAPPAQGPPEIRIEVVIVCVGFESPSPTTTAISIP